MGGEEDSSSESKIEFVVKLVLTVDFNFLEGALGSGSEIESSSTSISGNVSSEQRSIGMLLLSMLCNIDLLPDFLSLRLMLESCDDGLLKNSLVLDSS